MPLAGVPKGKIERNKKARVGGPELRVVIGRGEWIRTTDPSVPNRVLYQAEPRPDEGEMFDDYMQRPGTAASNPHSTSNVISCIILR